MNRLKNLFERRITNCCLTPHCWVKYLDFLDKEFKMKQESLPVFERAVRNVPFAPEVWIKYIRALEKYEEPIKVIR